jgi:hypothetical protein
MVETTIDADVRFEQHYAEVLAFVQKMKHVSCFELMKEFRLSYADSVHLMDILEERDIVDAVEPGTIKGPRPLLNGNKKRCPPPTPPSIESEPAATSVQPTLAPTSSAPTVKPSTPRTRRKR